jgi:hypothetical protein
MVYERKYYMKTWDEHLLRFSLDMVNDKIKMEMSLKDLVWLFENSPNNYIEPADKPYATVKSGNKNLEKFAEWIVEHLLDDSPGERDSFVWSEPFEYVFEQLAESGESFLEYDEDALLCGDDDDGEDEDE